MKTLIHDIREIIWLCKPYWKKGRIYLLLSIAISAITLIVDDCVHVKYPEIILNALSEGLLLRQIIILAVILSSISLLKQLLRLFFDPYFTRKETAISAELRESIYKKSLAIDYKYVDNPEYYEKYSWAIREYESQVNEARGFMVESIGLTASIIVLISLISVTSPWLLLAEAVQMTIHTLINVRVNKVDIAQKEAMNPIERRFDYWHRLFYLKDYAGDLRITHIHRTILKKYQETKDAKVKTASKYTRRIDIWVGMHEVVFTITEICVVIYLVRSIVLGSIPEIGMYMTMILAFYRLDNKLYYLVSMLQRANSLALNASKIKEFFEVEENIEVPDTNKLLPSNRPFDVQLEDIGFSYADDRVIKNLSAHFHPGEKIAVVGENGAGKTTLTKLLMRLYDVSSGVILVDGKPIQDYNIDMLRQRIGVAFQDSNVYAMSLYDNLSLYGEPNDMPIEKFASESGLALSGIEEKGYSTQLTKEFDSDGLVLSGGEAQKLALARLMGRKFSLLILDEPSAALDPIAEDNLCNRIMSTANRATTIIVSHRLSAVRNADHILVLHDGVICESGTHDELMAKGGRYYSMFTKQAQHYKE